MAKVCSITGAKVRRGGKIHRSGLAKKKGGIGRHITKVVKRNVSPNLHVKRIWVPELNLVSEEKEAPVWNAQLAFAGPDSALPVPLTPWEKFAQVLLSSNEFMYVD